MRQFRDDQDAVIRRNKDTVYRLARAGTKNPHDADDVFQEVFLRYLRKKPQFESEEHEKNWFIRVTVNCTHSAMTRSTLPRCGPMMKTETKSQPITRTAGAFPPKRVRMMNTVTRS